MKILILGANGQVGHAIKAVKDQFTGVKLEYADRDEIDLTHPSAKNKIISLKPNAIINLAAYTAVDLAEQEQELAQLINADAIHHIIAACTQLQIPFIHVSTDYVYHLDKNGPLVESDTCEPKSVYARTKHEGDIIALSYPKSIVVRTSWVYSLVGKNFLNTMLALKDRPSLTIVNDQIGAPTFAQDLAQALLSIAVKACEPNFDAAKYGIYHYSNEGAISWFDFAKAIFDLEGATVALTTTDTKTYNAPAPRPLWSVMSKQKIKAAFSIAVPHWHDGLVRCLGQRGS